MTKHSQKPEVHYARTQDGWKIALHHHPGKKTRHPILLVHGLASNYRDMDFPIQDLSLAKFLSGHGYDCWIVDLRGSGLSKKGTFTPYKGYFEDFVFQDLPAAVDTVLELTGAKKFHWIGHSLGGLLAFPFSNFYRQTKVIRSLITIASPVTTASRPGYFKITHRFDRIIKLFPRLPYKTLSKMATRFVDLVMGLEDNALFSRDNMTREILVTIMQHAVESVPTSLILQIHDWLNHNYFGSKDRKHDFTKSISEVTMPILMMAGSVDSFTPLADIRLAFRRIPSAKKTLMVFGKSRGHQNDYGHIDLVLGKNAPKEVFPHIVNWIKEHD
jgi:pimeloyl-ACP methyl ester carboxylesterase